MATNTSSNMEETDNIETANNETSMSLISDRPEVGKHDFMLVVSSKMMYKIGRSSFFCRFIFIELPKAVISLTSTIQLRFFYD